MEFGSFNYLLVIVLRQDDIKSSDVAEYPMPDSISRIAAKVIQLPSTVSANS